MLEQLCQLDYLHIHVCISYPIDFLLLSIHYFNVVVIQCGDEVSVCQSVYISSFT